VISIQKKEGFSEIFESQRKIENPRTISIKKRVETFFRVLLFFRQKNFKKFFLKKFQQKNSKNFLSTTMPFKEIFLVSEFLIKFE